MKEVNITKIEPLNGGAICKGGPGFIMEVRYTLADGRTVDSYQSTRRKKDMAGSLARAQQAAAAGAMRASFDDAGEYWGTVQSWSIGGTGGMVPSANAA